MNFSSHGYQIVKNAVNPDVCKLLSNEFKLIENISLHQNKTNPNYRHPDSKQEQFPFADEMVNSSFSWYSPLCFESLSTTFVRPIVESVVGCSVFPTYSYARIYYHGAEMKRHTDRSSSEFAVSCCIDIDYKNNWPIYFEEKSGNIIEVFQEPGDLIVYNGNELNHWRLPYCGNQQINAFMFYVNADGARTELKYDTRPGLGFGPTTRKLNSEEQWKKFVE
jgi:hypothetical protein